MKVFEIDEKDPSPSARSGHRLVSVGNCLILFGGYTQRQLSNSTPIGELKQDVWCFHVPTEQWKLLQTNRDNFPVSTASCAVVACGSKVLVFGGSGAAFGRSNSDKLQILDVTTLDWCSVALTGDHIEGGYGHSISITDDGYLYLYGGCDGVYYYNTMHKICLKTWRNTSFYRHNHHGCYRHESVEHEGNVFIIGGGCPIAKGDLGTIPYFCTNTNTWHILHTNSKDNPVGRMAHSCNKIHNNIIVTGGQVQRTIEARDNVQMVDIVYNDALSDVWLLNLQTFSWTKLAITLPQDIFFHSGAVANNGSLYTFGGSKYLAWNNSVGIPQRIHKRLNNLYKINIFVPSLMELAWSIFYDNFDYLEYEELVELGIPSYLAERTLQ